MEGEGGWRYSGDGGKVGRYSGDGGTVVMEVQW